MQIRILNPGAVLGSHLDDPGGEHMYIQGYTNSFTLSKENLKILEIIIENISMEIALTPYNSHEVFSTFIL